MRIVYVISADIFQIGATRLTFQFKLPHDFCELNLFMWSLFLFSATTEGKTTTEQESSTPSKLLSNAILLLQNSF